MVKVKAKSTVVMSAAASLAEGNYPSFPTNIDNLSLTRFNRIVSKTIEHTATFYRAVHHGPSWEYIHSNTRVKARSFRDIAELLVPFTAGLAVLADREGRDLAYSWWGITPLDIFSLRHTFESTPTAIHTLPCAIYAAYLNYWKAHNYNITASEFEDMIRNCPVELRRFVERHISGEMVEDNVLATVSIRPDAFTLTMGR